MKIYTRTGDDGDTGLLGGLRVRKDSPRTEALGSVDELNALLGLARTEGLAADTDRLLQRVQNELFALGAELGTPNPKAESSPSIDGSHVAALEQAIDAAQQALPPLRQFILPGGTRAAATLHLARAVCRRAERRVVHLAGDPAEHGSKHLIAYLNRLGDLLFVLARAANAEAGQGDVPWTLRGILPSGPG